VKEVDADKTKVWTRSELAFILRDSIASQSMIANQERDNLIAQLELIEDTLRPMAT